MARVRGQTIARSGLFGLGVAFACVVACGGRPPAFPEGSSLGDTTEAAGSGAGDDTAGAGSGSADDAGTVGAHDGDPMDDGTAGGIDDGGSTGDDLDPAGSSGGAATSATASGSSGAPADDPWFTGHYEGTWGGSCSLGAPIGNVDGNGTWSVDIDASGNIVGTYEGDVEYVGNVDGNIVGTVDESGVQMATAEGDALGACAWDGQLQKNGDGSGDIDCADGCNGAWQGSMQ